MLTSFSTYNYDANPEIEATCFPRHKGDILYSKGKKYRLCLRDWSDA